MEIILQYMNPDAWPAPAGWVVVGHVEGKAFAYDEARHPHLIGEGGAQPLDPVLVNRALAPAVEAAATRLFPEGWSYALAEAFGLNRRSLQRDRIARNGLHPNVLQELGAMACHDDAEGIGRLAYALAWYADRCSDRDHPADRLDDAEQGALNALNGLRRVRRGRVTKPDGDTDK
ncbi:hypothetical protein [Methylobacterium sp. A52T]